MSRALKFLANENFPLRSILYQKNKGFDIRSIGIDHPGIRDEEVMTIAIEEKRTLHHRIDWSQRLSDLKGVHGVGKPMLFP